MAEMADLFADTLPDHRPLAERLRPQVVADVVGQAHLLGEGKPLRVAIESGEPHSMIFWGPPGVGKTTLARLMAHAFSCEFIALSAVFAGVKEIREAMQQAERNRQLGRRTLVFVDEIHRFNKAQQDAFLPYIESGLIVFLGATTENPSFEVNAALLSRAQVHILHSLDEADLRALIQKALQVLPKLSLTEDAQTAILAYADGDGRRLLNVLEQLYPLAAQYPQVDAQQVGQVLQFNARRFDKGGDAFYEQISALHKSVRGSNPDGALYWLCRMLDGGADPLYIARRLVRMAVEDIGLADPRALEICLNASQTYERLGSPEGELALAQAAIYLAIAAKSNAVYKAYKQARALIQQDASLPVPMHLRNAPTQLMKSQGYGDRYRYAHDESDAYAAGERYLPDGVEGGFYQPTDRGMEAKIKEKLDYLHALDAQAQGGLYKL